MQTNINFRCDSDLKTNAENLFNDLGISMSAALTMFLKQAVREQRIPFVLRRDIPNATTIKALDEYQAMKSDKTSYKRYSSFDDVLKEIQNDA